MQMTYTRREMMAAAAAAVPAIKWIGNARLEAAAQAAKPNSVFGGVQIGAISYCFRQISYSPEDVLKGMVALGLNVIELEQSFFEHYLGAPPDPTGGGQPQGVGTVRAGGPFGDRSPNAGRGGPQPGRGGRGTMTPEQDAALKQIRADLRRWRLSAPMEKARALRKMYDDAGVEIRLVKFPQLGGPEMTDEEVDYCFLLAKAMNARGLTAEPPLSSTKRIARFAEKHRMIVGYHGHSNATGVENFGRTGAWEQAFFYSKYHWANVDVGHFTAGNNFPPTEFIKEYHDRITNLHLKDRKINQGANLPWGQGDTPIKEILQLVKREKYTFPAMIELEYPIPADSSVMDEMAKCVQFCKDALA
jgi:sugar phosphate isomerase/epimerase